MVYVFLADGFEECEALVSVDLLRRAKIDVKTVKITHGSRSGDADLIVNGSHYIPVTADICECDISINSAEMLILPGGALGTQNMFESPAVAKGLGYAFDNHIKIGAICAAPSILARFGYLKGKAAVCYPTFEKYLTENGASVSTAPVVTDGIFTTAKAAGVSVQFALELITILRDRETAEDIKNQIYF